MKSLRRVAALALLALTAAPAFAEDYPNRTVTVVVPTAPGGMLGLLGRLVGTNWSSVLARPSSSRIVRARAPQSEPRRSRARRPTDTRC